MQDPCELVSHGSTCWSFPLGPDPLALLLYTLQHDLFGGALDDFCSGFHVTYWIDEDCGFCASVSQGRG